MPKNCPIGMMALESPQFTTFLQFPNGLFEKLLRKNIFYSPFPDLDIFSTNFSATKNFSFSH